MQCWVQGAPPPNRSIIDQPSPFGSRISSSSGIRLVSLPFNHWPAKPLRISDLIQQWDPPPLLTVQSLNSQAPSDLGSHPAVGSASSPYRSIIEQPSPFGSRISSSSGIRLVSLPFNHWPAKPLRIPDLIQQWDPPRLLTVQSLNSQAPSDLVSHPAVWSASCPSCIRSPQVFRLRAFFHQTSSLLYNNLH